MNPVIKAFNAGWEAMAIEACRNDPRIKELGLCYVCLTPLPNCLCMDHRKPGNNSSVTARKEDTK